jgi:hypothetical protein
MLAFASIRLRSKLDILNGTRWLRYLDPIFSQTFQMKRDRLTN